MKKLFSFLLALSLAAAPVSFGAATDETHKHEWEEWDAVDKESHARSCECGETETEAHVWGEWVPDEDMEEYHLHSCSVCGVSVHEFHTFGKWTKMDNTIHRMTCSVCGATREEEHTWGGWEQDGETNHKRLCAVCDGIQSEAHSYGNAEYAWSEDLSACTATGKCTVCGEEGQEAGTVTSAVTTDPTCEEEGIRTYTAVFTRQGFVRQTALESVKATGHDWAEEWTIDETDHWHICHNGCGMADSKAAHLYGEVTYTWKYTDGKWTCTATHNCTVCGYTETETGTVTSAVKIAPDCVTDGTTAYTAVFETPAFTAQNKDVTDLEHFGHSWGEEWYDDGDGGHFRSCVNERCTARTDEGKHTGGTAVCTAAAVCEVCGLSYGKRDPNHHRLTGSPAVDATCTQDGSSAWWVCGWCKKYFSDEAGKTEISKDSWIIPAFGHTVVKDEAVKPTCTETGLTEGRHCSVCGEVFVKQEILNARGHREVADEAVEPTCTEPGLTRGSHCVDCNATLIPQRVADPLGHTEVTDEALEPTCTEDGLTAGSHCSVCGEVFQEQKRVPALGHHYGEWTQAADGKHIAVCENCGRAISEACRMEETWSFGKTAIYTCAVCGRTDTVTKPEEETGDTPGGLPGGQPEGEPGEEPEKEPGEKSGEEPKEGHTEHTEEEDPAVAATCTEDGLTAGSHCSVCGEVLTEQETIPATGHMFGKWTAAANGKHTAVCSVCGITTTASCKMVEARTTGSVTIMICPVCGRTETAAKPEKEPETEPKDEPEDEPKDEPEDEPKDEPEDVPEDEPEDVPEDEPEDVPEDEPEDVPEDEPKDEPKDEPEITDASDIVWVLLENAAGDTDEGMGTLRVYAMMVRGTPAMLMISLEKDGEIRPIDNPTSVILPADVIEGWEIYRIDAEGNKAVLEVQTVNGLAAFVIDPDMAEKPGNVILLQVRKK